MKIITLIRNSLVIFVFSIITFSSVIAQKPCQWETLPAFQKKFSKEIKKISVNVSNQTFIEKIYFVDENRGWILGSNFVSSTNDGGKSWKTKKIKSLIVNEMFFADQTKGWHILVNEFTTVRIYQTLDGGKTWKYLKDISTSLFGNIDSRVFGYVPTILNVRFINDDIIWVVGLKKIKDSMEYAIWKTINGGKTWETKYLSNTSILRKTLEASFIKLNDSRIIVSSNGLILQSEDNGESWKEVANINSSENSTPDFFKGFDFTDEFNSWATVANSGKIFRSIDRGKIWKAKKLGLMDEDSYKFTSVKFINSKTGWIGGSKNNGEKMTGVILFTTDGGETWTNEHQTESKTINSLTSTSKTVFAVGNDGLILKRSIANCVN
jgi:photosystem II stability/assembly factor-like uncharacterized protein